MNAKSFFATLALLACATAPLQASAGSLSGGIFTLDWVNNIGSETSSYTERTVNVTMTQTAASDGSFEAIVSGDRVDFVSSFSVYLSVGVDAPKDMQLRFSYWQVTVDLTVQKLSDSSIVYSGTQNISGTGQRGMGDGYSFNNTMLVASDYRITGSYAFTPGSYLSPSNDPLCASLACMTVNTDTAKAMVTLVGSSVPVPEPASGMLLLTGLGLAALRRLKQQQLL